MNKKETKTQLLPHEVLEKIATVSATKTRVSILKNNPSFALKSILQANFREDIQFDIPDGVPPYRPDSAPAGNQAQHIDKAIKSLKHVLKESPMPPVKKESTFIKLLETVHAEDAKVILAMKDKRLREAYPGITENVVRKAYPNLLPKEVAS